LPFKKFAIAALGDGASDITSPIPATVGVIVAASSPVSLASITNILASVRLLPPGNAPAIEHNASADTRALVWSLAAAPVSRRWKLLRDGCRDPRKDFEGEQDVEGQLFIEQGGEIRKELLEEGSQLVDVASRPP
jgi:hypothetical protein